ncbi:hypothetical protein WJX73_003561, partial [Symbiochloris irregularis]
MSILWANWEGALSQMVKQVQAAFDALLDIAAAQQHLQLASEPFRLDVQSMLESTARDLLALGEQRKGKYAPLQALIPRIGAQHLLQMHPPLLRDTLMAMRIPAVCPSAASLLHILLQHLLTECSAAHPGSRTSARMSAQDAQAQDGQVAALVGLVRQGRKLHLMPELHRACVDEQEVIIPAALLLQAAEHASDLLRIDALELACISPKITVLPGDLELQMACKGLQLALSNSAASTRNKTLVLADKLLKRLCSGTHASLQVLKQLRRKHIKDGSGPAELSKDEHSIVRGILAQKDMASVLLGTIVDSWDRVREQAAAALQWLPTPLPGVETPEALICQVEWAAGLLSSPRVREADAGARLAGLLFQKYAQKLGWHMSLHPSACALEAALPGNMQATLTFLDSLLASMQASLDLADSDLVAACRTGLNHGVLLLIRYVVPSLPWHSAAHELPALRDWVVRLLAVLDHVAVVAMPPLCHPADHGMSDEQEADDQEGPEAGFFDDGLEGPNQDAATSQAQIISTACWLTMKELAMLVGTLMQVVPLTGPGHVLNAGQVQHLGQQFLHTFVNMKHNGAVDKTMSGFQAVVTRLLTETLPELHQLPTQWLDALLAAATRPNQTRDDIVRRSAGLPVSIVAIFLSEPDNTRKVLLARGMSAILHISSGAVSSEVWPRVHAFNILRLIFQEAKLAVSTTGYCAEGMQLTMQAMAAGAWEVRNAANMTFTSLINRMLGFKNLAKGEAPKRAVTAVDFFRSFPSLHAFLLSGLQQAAAELEQNDAAQRLHPMLFPTLVLLSRLRPATHSRSTIPVSCPDPEAFAPVVQRRRLSSASSERCPNSRPFITTTRCMDPSYEARCAGLKALLRLTQGVSRPAATPPSWLPGLVSQHGSSETHFKATERNLRLTAVLAAWSDRQGNSMPSLPNQEQIYAIDSSGALHLSRHWNSSCLDCEPLQRLHAWVLDVWAVAVCLLQDEAAQVRMSMSAVVHGILAAASRQAVRHTHDSVLLRCTLRHLSQCYCMLPQLQRLLMQWVYRPGPGGTASRMDQLHSSLTYGRRLFDVELDNQHEEPLFLAQAAASELLHVQSCMEESSDAAAAGWLEQMRLWASEVAEELAQESSRMAGLQQASKAAGWGDITHLESCFLPLAH